MHALNILGIILRSFSGLFFILPQSIFLILSLKQQHVVVQPILKRIKIFYLRSLTTTFTSNRNQKRNAKQSLGRVIFFQNYRLPTISTFFAAVEKEMLLK